MNTVLLIGSGKLARHLNHWFSLNNSRHNKLLTWDRHQDPHLIHSYLNSSLSPATHVWLAISDSALIPFYEKYIQGHDVVSVHFSGALHDDRLIAAHPLMSFGPELYSDDVYQKIQFGLTGINTLDQALPGFTNKFFHVAAADKPLYHALSVMAGNFPQILWSELYQLAEKHQIPQAALDVYIHQITENFIRFKSSALTGPFVRKDLITIEKNLNALEKTKLKSIYSSFQKEFLK